MLLYSIRPRLGPFLLIFFSFCSSTNGFGQLASVLSVHGNNIASVDCGGIVFSTPTNTYHKTEGSGSAWVKKPIDLRMPFEVRFFTEFITHPDAAVDGGAFVFQQDTTSVGDADFGLGFRGIGASIAITLDTYQNDRDNDPPFDHIGIQANGNTDHNSSDNLVTPVSIMPFYAPPVPGNTDHLFSATW